MKLRLSLAADLISCQQVADCVMKIDRFILLCFSNSDVSYLFTLPVF